MAANWVLLQVYHSMMQAARGVVQQHGVRGLYRGLNITLLEIIPYAALQFGLYDTFTAAWSKAHRRRLSAKVICSVQLFLKLSDTCLSIESHKHDADAKFPCK